MLSFYNEINFVLFFSLKELAYKQNGQRTKLKNNNAEMRRLIQEIQDFGKVIVSGSKVRMDDWLVSGKRGRHAEVAPTQGSDGLSQSQSTNATSEGPSQPTDEEYDLKAEFSDDVTASGEEDENSKRSLDTDGQEEEESSDSSYKRHKSKRKKEKKRAKKEKKEEKRKKKARREKESSFSSPSFG